MIVVVNRSGSADVCPVTIPTALLNGRKTQLAHSLIELRAKHEKKLTKLLKKSDIREIHKRLRKGSKEADFHAARDPLSVAKKIEEAVPVFNAQPTEEILHQRRLAVKRARYAAELAIPSKESALLIGNLKKMQDALGHWHDWITLTRTAIDHFGEVNESSLVAALQNGTRGKFRQAAATLMSTTPTQQGARNLPITRQIQSTQSAA